LDLLFQIKKTDEKSEGAEEAGNDSGSDYSSNASPFDHISVYKQILELMKPGESVAKSLQRLGELITFCIVYLFYAMICIILRTKWTHGI
jgi:hypothetical protein